MDYDIVQSNNGLGKIGSMVMYLIQCISALKQKQQDRIRNNSRIRRTRSRSAEEEKINDNFIIAMDNYFTLPKVIKALRDSNIGVVGTARFGRGWPPAELKKISDKETNAAE